MRQYFYITIFCAAIGTSLAFAQGEIEFPGGDPGGGSPPVTTGIPWPVEFGGSGSDGIPFVVGNLIKVENFVDGDGITKKRMTDGGSGGTGDITRVWDCLVGDCLDIALDPNDGFDASGVDPSVANAVTKPFAVTNTRPATCEKGELVQDDLTINAGWWWCETDDNWRLIVSSDSTIINGNIVIGGGNGVGRVKGIIGDPTDCTGLNFAKGINADATADGCAIPAGTFTVEDTDGPVLTESGLKLLGTGGSSVACVDGGITGDCTVSSIFRGCFRYFFNDFSQGAGNPGIGQVDLTGAIGADPNTLQISTTTKNGLDMSTAFRRLNAGDAVGITEVADSTRSLDYVLTAGTDNTTWVSLTGDLVASGTQALRRQRNVELCVVILPGSSAPPASTPTVGLTPTSTPTPTLTSTPTATPTPTLSATPTPTITVTPDGVGYDEVMEEGSGLTKRAQLNFVGANLTCVDNPGATRTDCTITGGGGTVTDVYGCDGSSTPDCTDLVLASGDSYDATSVDPNNPAGGTSPYSVNSTTPATCTVGEMMFDNSGADFGLKICAATNIWEFVARTDGTIVTNTIVAGAATSQGHIKGLINPSNCTGDNFAKGIASSGVAECAALPATGGLTEFVKFEATDETITSVGEKIFDFGAEVSAATLYAIDCTFVVTNIGDGTDDPQFAIDVDGTTPIIHLGAHGTQNGGARSANIVNADLTYLTVDTAAGDAFVTLGGTVQTGTGCTICLDVYAKSADEDITLRRGAKCIVTEL